MKEESSLGVNGYGILGCRPRLTVCARDEICRKMSFALFSKQLFFLLDLILAVDMEMGQFMHSNSNTNNNKYKQEEPNLLRRFYERIPHQLLYCSLLPPICDSIH